MSHTMKDAVHVDLRVGTFDYSGEYGPGDVDLPGPVADLLVAQGFATPNVAKAKVSKASTTSTESNPEA